MLLACFNAFLQDDAFISFRYAANLAHGHGLVWNPGERVEGYTNFLWTLILALSIRLGADPVLASWVLGIACFALTLVFAYRLAALVLGSRARALLAAGLLGTNYTFSCYATGGLETQLQACLLTASAYFALRVLRAGTWPASMLLALSLAAPASLLTRLDSALYLAALYGALLWKLATDRRTKAARAASALWLCLPVVLVVGAWMAWKLAYYGDILPNTFYTKRGGLASIKYGVYYLDTFVTSYWLAPFAFVALLAARGTSAAGRMTAIPIVILATWCIYVTWAGGDFMEFRFLVPIMPLLFIVIVWLSTEFVRQREIGAALAAMTVAGSVGHALCYRQVGYIESVSTLRSHLSAEGEDWVGVGRELGRIFGGPEHITLATSAAGAISYYSGLEVVDMLGLTDRWVARNGRAGDPRPGHRRQATTGYLLNRGVNLVIGQPWVVAADAAYPRASPVEEVRSFRLPDATSEQVPPGARVLEIPLGPNRKVFVLYLVPSPAVDRAIAVHGLKSHSVFGN